MAIKPSVLKRVSARIQDLSTEVVEKKFCGLFFGDKGTGKTTASSGLAQKLRGEGRILRLDSSDGWVSLDNIPALKRNTDNIENVTIEELAAIIDAISRRDPAYRKYTVVILDEISTWYTEMLYAYVREQLNVPDDQPIPQFDWNMYGPPQAALKDLINRLHRTPGVHLIMVAHEQERAIKGDAQAKRMVPSMGTKLSDGLGQIAHVVGRFTATEKRSGQTTRYVREVQCWPTRLVDAKTRIGALDKSMEQSAFVKAVSEWVGSDSMPQDLTKAVKKQADTEEVDDSEEAEEDFEVPDEDTDEDEDA